MSGGMCDFPLERVITNNFTQGDETRLIPTLQGLSTAEIDIRFEAFYNQIDKEAISKLKNQPLDEIHKELMRKSFIKHDGYFYPNEVWPEKFGRKFGS